ncbi:MAG: hypothetical protein V4857_26725 [Pseudomonadota bacterium]
MIKLPRPLEPWREWLALMEPELVDALGQLLLQLHPLVGRLVSAAPSPDTIPAGVGSIVRRGQYDRMLISEWAYADAEPDEFIRRAASGELLFTGPEPELRRRSRVCIALFDAGPSQLGEPRLVHLALFILLARRAQDAGADFRWGVLQAPSAWRDDFGISALRHLFAQRSLESVGAAHLAYWNAQLAALDAGLPDCWQVGGGATPALAHTTARVAVARTLLDDDLQVAVTCKRSVRELQLRLPEPALGVRLLRHPLAGAVDNSHVRHTKRVISIKTAPHFASSGRWLALPALDGGVVIFNVPQSVEAVPGKVRSHSPHKIGTILGANIFKRALAQVVSEGDSLRFTGFPGRLFSGDVLCPRPDAKQFRAPPGLSRWLPTFFIAPQVSVGTSECVFVLDINKQLVCWEKKSQTLDKPPMFGLIADSVVGAAQFNHELVYARCAAGQVDIYRWSSGKVGAEKVDTIAHSATRVLFAVSGWHKNKTDCMLGLQIGDTEWLLVHAGVSSRIDITDGAMVVGLAAAHKGHVGLVVLHPDKKTVQVRTRDGSPTIDVLKSELPILQLSVDGAGRRLAWLVHATHALTVRDLYGEKALLHVIGEEVNDAS